jgi:hypothetical protein
MSTKTIKRIPGIGTMIDATLILTQQATRDAGYLLAPGYDGGEHARRVRASIAAAAIGKRVEVHASRRGSQGWVADVVEPRFLPGVEVEQ